MRKDIQMSITMLSEIFNLDAITCEKIPKNKLANKLNETSQLNTDAKMVAGKLLKVNGGD